MVLNYNVDLNKLKKPQEPVEPKQNPQTFVSKQNVLMNALSTRMPQQPQGGMQQPATQSTGWGKTTA